MTSEQFIEKWSNWFLFDKNHKELKMAFERELESLINDKPMGQSVHRCRTCGYPSPSVYCSVQCKEDAS